MLDITRYWYQPKLSFINFILLPFTFIFSLIVKLRWKSYQLGILKIQKLNVPVIVVGNITVGGTGKTPTVILLAQFLKAQGFKPGIVTRGVGGKLQKKIYWVSEKDDAQVVGDEALLLRQHTDCPIVIGKNRAAVVRDLLQKTNCNVVICDDGLQHYRLGRDIEIAIVDGKRRFGNQYLLPAGPLREAISRLNTVDFVIVNDGDKHDDFILTLQPQNFISIKNSQQKINSTDFPAKKIHAVAAIGHPERFFLTLKNLGFDIIQHVFPDHHLYQAADFKNMHDFPIVMTEKDAVKCQRFAHDDYWYLAVTATINNNFTEKLLKKLQKLGVTHETEIDFTTVCAHIHTHHNECQRGE